MSNIEDTVAQKIIQRAEMGYLKYGKTLMREDIARLGWLVHAQEEAMDLCNYLEVLIQKEQEEIRNSKNSTNPGTTL